MRGGRAWVARDAFDTRGGAIVRERVRFSRRASRYGRGHYLDAGLPGIEFRAH